MGVARIFQNRGGGGGGHTESYMPELENRPSVFFSQIYMSVKKRQKGNSSKDVKERKKNAKGK